MSDNQNNFERHPFFIQKPTDIERANYEIGLAYERRKLEYNRLNLKPGNSVAITYSIHNGSEVHTISLLDPEKLGRDSMMDQILDQILRNHGPDFKIMKVEIGA